MNKKPLNQIIKSPSLGYSVQSVSSISVLGIIIWLLVLLFYWYEFFLRAIVGTLAKQLIASLHLTAEQFAFLGSAYYFAYGVMQIPVGMIADKMGVRHALLLGVVICVLSVFGLAWSSHFYQAVVSRMFMGLGSSFAFVCLLTIIMAWFPRKNFAFFSASSQFIGTMGPLLAAGPLAVLLAQLGGDWRFLLNSVGVFGVLLVLLIYYFVQNKPDFVLKPLSFPHFTQIVSTQKLKLRFADLFRNTQAVLIFAYSALVYGPMALLGALWGALYLQAYGYTQATAASIVSISWLAYALGCLLLGIFSDLIKKRKLIFIMCAVLGLLATVGIVFINQVSVYLSGSLFAMLGVAASGQSLTYASITDYVRHKDRVIAFAVNNGSVIVFTVLLPIIIGLTVSLSKGLREALYPHDFMYGFSIFPIMYFVALVNAIFFMEEAYGQDQIEESMVDHMQVEQV